jgi:hypothetical protein
MATQTPLPTTERAETPDFDQTIANIDSGKIQIFGLPDALFEGLSPAEISWLPTLLASARPRNPEDLTPYGTEDHDKKNWLKDQRLSTAQFQKLEALYHLFFVKETALDYLYKKHQDAKDELAVLQIELDKFTTTCDTQSTRIALLKQENKKLQSELSSAHIQIGQAAIRAATTPNPPVTPSPAPSHASPAPDGRRTAKIVDPEKFTGERDASGKTVTPYKQWRLLVQSKLEGNADHYPTDKSQVMYIYGRTGGEAAGHLEPHLVGDALPLQDPASVWKVLDSIYVDPDEKNKAKNEYRKLKQANKNFPDFLTQFTSLAKKAGIHLEDYYEEFWDKLSSENRTALAPSKDEIQSYDALVKKVRHLETQREIEASRRRPFGNKTPFTDKDKTPAPRSFSRPQTPAPRASPAAAVLRTLATPQQKTL